MYIRKGYGALSDEAVIAQFQSRIQDLLASRVINKEWVRYFLKGLPPSGLKWEDLSTLQQLYEELRLRFRNRPYQELKTILHC